MLLSAWDKIYQFPQWNRFRSVLGGGWTVSFFLWRTPWLYHLTVFFEVVLKIIGHTHSRKKKTWISKPHVNDCRSLCTLQLVENSSFQGVPSVKRGTRNRQFLFHRDHLFEGGGGPLCGQVHSLCSESERNFVAFSNVEWSFLCVGLGSQLDCRFLGCRGCVLVLLLCQAQEACASPCNSIGYQVGLSILPVELITIVMALLRAFWDTLLHINKAELHFGSGLKRTL